MTIKYGGRTALVTGASGGIGGAICRLLVEQDYRVVATARSLDRLQTLQQQLGPKLCALRLDVNDPAATARLASSLPAGFDRIDILINNAGHDTGGRRRFDEGSAGQWCDIVETNLQGMIRVTHALVGGMLERGHGQIINIGSIAGMKPYAGGSAYVSSKYAVHGLSETLRLDYAGKGIRVTEIMPGLVRSGFARQRLGDAAQAQAFYDSFDACLLPEDVAATVCFALAQPEHVEIAQLVVLPAA